MSLHAGSTMLGGQYRIVEWLGRGGFGFVYCAQDCLLGEQVAIKELIPSLLDDEAALKRFLAEAKATMRLTHHGIVRTHNVFSEAGNYYIAMEYMPGGSLEARLRDSGSLPVDEAVRVTGQICEGLSHAHALGVVHCDLKPANILFADDGSAKVADFGIAHVSEQTLTRSWLTPAGFVAGTLPYMSPEQTDGVRDDPRVDVYAVGAVLYRMLTGRTYLDFDQRDTPRASADNVYRIRVEQPPAPSDGDPRVPRWLDGIVLKALEKQPQERFASVEEIGTALKTRQAAVAAVPTAMAAIAEVPAKRGPAPVVVPPGDALTMRRRVQAAVPPNAKRLFSWFQAASVGEVPSRVKRLRSWFGATAGAAAPKVRRLPSWFRAAVAGAATLVLVLLGFALGTGGGEAATIPDSTGFEAIQPTAAASEATPSATETLRPTDTHLALAPTSPPTAMAIQAPTNTPSPEPTRTPAAMRTAKRAQVAYPVPVPNEPDDLDDPDDLDEPDDPEDPEEPDEPDEPEEPGEQGEPEEAEELDD